MVDAKSVFIVGSCVSRDVFSRLQTLGHTLCHYGARQSLISAFSSAPFELVDRELFSSPFQYRMVREDFQGTTMELLSENRSAIDLILWDLVDERRGVLRLTDGTIVTDNWELEHSGLRERLPIESKIEFGTDEHFDLWIASAKAFVLSAEELGLRNRILCLAPDFAYRRSDGTAIVGEGIFGPRWLTRAYRRYYSFVEKELEVTVLRNARTEAVSPLGHKWGVAPYHYGPEVETELVQQIASHMARREWNDRESRSYLDAKGRFASYVSPAEEGLVPWTYVSAEGAGVHGKVRSVDGSRTLTVFFNGAVDPTRAGGSPVFQRSSWASELEGSLLFLSDPTITQTNGLKIGWGQGAPGASAIPLLVGAVEGMVEALGGRENVAVLLYGSSAGGFQALSVASFLSVDRVLVNNPQFDWLKYEVRWAVKEVLDFSYAGESQVGFRERHRLRVSLLDLWRSYGFVPSMKYLLNSASEHDVSQQFEPFSSQVLSNMSLLAGSEVSVRTYSDAGAGHNPLGMEATVREIAELLASIKVSRAWGDI